MNYKITGTASVGYALTASTGTWSDTDTDTLTYTYQWYRASDAAGTGDAVISGATSATYTLTTSDAYKHIRVVVTANDANGSATQTATSARTSVNDTAPVLTTPTAITLTDTVGGRYLLQPEWRPEGQGRRHGTTSPTASSTGPRGGTTSAAHLQRVEDRDLRHALPAQHDRRLCLRAEAGHQRADRQRQGDLHPVRLRRDLE